MRPGVWGRKVGMTQIFTDEFVVPVTAINVADWYVTAIKTVVLDGYVAVQIACPRDRYLDREKDIVMWMKKPRKFFAAIREVRVPSDIKVHESCIVGEKFDPSICIGSATHADITGITKGAGFAGVVRRHNYAGAPASHGATMGKRPGSLSFMTACGKVIKGKGMPGHMGVKRRVSRNLEIISFDLDSSIVLVKGSVPGKAGSFVHIQAA